MPVLSAGRRKNRLTWEELQWVSECKRAKGYMQTPTNSIAARKFRFLDCQHRAPKEVGSDLPAHDCRHCSLVSYSELHVRGLAFQDIGFVVAQSDDPCPHSHTVARLLCSSSAVKPILQW